MAVVVAVIIVRWWWSRRRPLVVVAWSMMMVVVGVVDAGAVVGDRGDCTINTDGDGGGGVCRQGHVAAVMHQTRLVQ